MADNKHNLMPVVKGYGETYAIEILRINMTLDHDASDFLLDIGVSVIQSEKQDGL